MSKNLIENKHKNNVITRTKTTEYVIAVAHADDGDECIDQPFLMRISDSFTCTEFHQVIYLNLSLLMMCSSMEDIFRMPHTIYFQEVLLDGFLKECWYGGETAGDVPEDKTIMDDYVMLLGQITSFYCGKCRNLQLWIYLHLMEIAGNYCDSNWSGMLYHTGYNIYLDNKIPHTNKYKRGFPYINQIPIDDLKLEYYINLKEGKINHVVIEWRFGQFGKIYNALKMKGMIKTKDYILWERDGSKYKEYDNDKLDINDCFESYLADNEYKYQCGNCKQFQVGKKQVELLNLPDLLVVYLDRYIEADNVWDLKKKSNGDWFIDKEIRAIDEQLIINMGDGKAKGYQLLGVIELEKDGKSVRSVYSKESSNDLPFVLFFRAE